MLVVYVSLSMVLLAAGASYVTGQGAESYDIEFSTYGENPIIPVGEAGEWDSGFVRAGKVVVANGSFHMFYIGGDEYRLEPRSIGYATSDDGLHWEKSARNPVLVLDDEIAQHGASVAVPLFENNSWVLYISLRTNTGSDESILRATARGPAGPWAVDETPIFSASTNRWDDVVIPDSLVRLEDRYLLYYTGKHTASAAAASIGMAESSDGITWAKFNDPETGDEELAESDPLIMAGEAGHWDDASVMAGCVHRSEAGWEMFYSGLPAGEGSLFEGMNIGYATSSDGIEWNRHAEGPILPSDENRWISSVAVVNDTYYLYYTIWPEDGMMLQIGVATGTIVRGESAE